MKQLFTLLVSTIVLLGHSTLVKSAENDWNYKASVYLFTAKTETSTASPFGTVSAELSFSDALNNLDLALMGAFEASNGRWSFIGDYMMTDLSFSENTPGPILSSAKASVKTQVFSGYALYRVHATATANFDIGGGFRWFSTDTEISLIGGAGNGLSFGADDNWSDPLIAARLRVNLSDRWSGTIFGDYGSFGNDNENWQVLLTLNYTINDHWLLQGGYRHMEVQNDVDGARFSFEQSGPVIGMAYQF